MGKASSHWYTPEGKVFHQTAKQSIMQVVNGNSPLETLKVLSCINLDWFKKTQTHLKIVCPTCNNALLKRRTCKSCGGRGWVEIENPEHIEPSLEYLVQMNERLWSPMAPCLKGAPIMERMVIKRVQYFMLALYHSDDMYYERIGWLIGRFAYMAAEWWPNGHACATRAQIMSDLYKLREEYFVHEHRTDRIGYLEKIFAYVLKYIDDNEWAFELMCWYGEYLQKYPWTFYDEVSRHDLQAFHPENWYPVGRGRVWDLVHGGRG